MSWKKSYDFFFKDLGAVAVLKNNLNTWKNQTLLKGP